MVIYFKTILLLFTSAICLVNSAKILGILGVNSYSHFILSDRIYKALAARGHEVTVITPIEEKNPVKNYNTVILTGFIEMIDAARRNIFLSLDQNKFSKLIEYENLCLQFAEKILNHTNVQQLLNSNKKFDLVIHEKNWNDALYGFSHYYRVPSIVINPVGITVETTLQIGNPYNPSYIPNIHQQFSSKMNFMERIFNVISYLVQALVHEFYRIPKHNKLIQKYFPGSTHLKELMSNTSLIFLNSHRGTTIPVPLLPNMIEIGGYHILPPNPLPQELRDYLDSSRNGVIFVSMGSNFKSTYFSEQMSTEMLTSFSKLKQNILWKWESDIFPGQPPNVKIGKWLPQQDILAHPNVKLFVTHGGLLSILESLHYGIPILAMPLFGDHWFNVKRAVELGYGLEMSVKKFNGNTFDILLNEMLNNPKYSENAKQRSMVIRDQPQPPLERAVYWIEYIIKHKGAPHLKSTSLNLAWYQNLLLDVIVVVVLAIAILILIFYKIVRMLRHSRRCRTIKKLKKTN